MTSSTPKDQEAFALDVRERGGYQYSTNASLSSRMANKRISDAVLAAADFHGKRILDIGCGDGEYTIEMYDLAAPTYIEGIEVVQEAISLARQKIGSRNIQFNVGSAYELQYSSNSFDIAHIRGVLHHMDRPEIAIGEALRVASFVVIAEPNGNNPGLKVIEKVSPYHVAHHEKSYSSRLLNSWIRKAGGTIRYQKWVGLVPMFCPDWMAKTAKFLEPVLEAAPVLNSIGCALYVVTATRMDIGRQNNS